MKSLSKSLPACLCGLALVWGLSCEDDDRLRPDDDTPAAGAAGAAGGSSSAGAAGRASAGAAPMACRVIEPSSADTEAAPEREPCELWARAECERMITCEPHALQRSYGDEATCVNRHLLGCLALRFDAPGTSRTAAGVTACAQAVSALSCDGYGVHADIKVDANGNVTPIAFPSACGTLPGALADGAGCADGAQCASTVCLKRRGASCGTCAKRVALGEVCATSPFRSEVCLRGRCEPATGLCAPLAAQGEPCDDPNPCNPGLVCRDGLCRALPAAGDPCDASDPWHCLRPLGGLVCDAATGTCQPSPTPLPAGERCAFVSDAVCAGAGTCNLNFEGPNYGVCLPPAADGARCGACMLPAVCGSPLHDQPDGYTAEAAQTSPDVCRVPRPVLCECD